MGSSPSDSEGMIHGQPAVTTTLSAAERRELNALARRRIGGAGGRRDRYRLGISGARAARLKNAGAPADFIFQDPPLTLNETMAVGALAKSPYAAALLMEFVTDVSTMEASDKVEPGRVFGHNEGEFTIPLPTEVSERYPRIAIGN